MQGRQDDNSWEGAGGRTDRRLVLARSSSPREWLGSTGVCEVLAPDVSIAALVVRLWRLGAATSDT